MLRQGVEEWNNWRLIRTESGCFYPPKLSGADLSRVNLSGADLRWVDLSDANLFEADLSGARLSGATLYRAFLLDATLNRADLGDARLSWANLSGAKLSGANLSGTDLTWTDLRGACLSEANLKGARLNWARLSEANLSGAYLRGANLSQAIKTLAGLSRVIIADITNPKSSPLELQATMPDYMIPFVPIIHEGEKPFSMFRDLKQKYDEWVLDVLEYDSIDGLLEVLEQAVVRPALVKAEELLYKKTEKIRKRHVKDYKNIARPQSCPNQSMKPLSSLKGL